MTVLLRLQYINVYYIIYCGIVRCNATLYVLFNNWFDLVANARDLAVPSRLPFQPQKFFERYSWSWAPRARAAAAESCEKNC